MTLTHLSDIISIEGREPSERKGTLGTFTTKRDCEQKCGNLATAYAGGRSANDWAGYYCDTCTERLGFQVFDRYEPNPSPTTQVRRELQSIDTDLVMLAKVQIFDWSPTRYVRNAKRALARATALVEDESFEIVDLGYWHECTARIEGWLYEIENYKATGKDPCRLAENATVHLKNLEWLVDSTEERLGIEKIAQ